MNEESSGLQFGKFGLSKKRFRSLAGDRDIWQGAFSQRLSVRTVVSSLGERNPTQEIPSREGRDLGTEGAGGKMVPAKWGSVWTRMNWSNLEDLQNQWREKRALGQESGRGVSEGWGLTLPSSA